MKLRTFGIGLATLVLAAAGSARAGFNSINTNLPDSMYYADPANGALGITGPSSDLSDFQLTVNILSDPTLNVWETITNDSGSPWDSYTVTVVPGDGYSVSNLAAITVPTGPPNYYVDYLPLSTVDPVANTITYYGGTVPVGQDLQAIFSFTITANAGTYSYQVLNSPHEVPEPASLAMVGLGAAFLLRRRR